MMGKGYGSKEVGTNRQGYVAGTDKKDSMLLQKRFNSKEYGCIQGKPRPVCLSLPELHKLFALLSEQIKVTTDYILHWSNWRRMHQAIAKQYRFRKQNSFTLQL
ncbi:MAG: hypothetical protein LKJ45_06160 [Oscillospiraceae bacterium]|nr:hypothetical protein [Oscillospiraceae bacterium]